MRCPHCGFDNRSYEVRCRRCGDELVDPNNLPLSRNKPRPGKYTTYEDDPGEYYGRNDSYRDSYGGGRDYDDSDDLGDRNSRYQESTRYDDQAVTRRADPRRPLSTHSDQEPERSVTIRPERKNTYKPGGLHDRYEENFYDEEAPSRGFRNAEDKERLTERRVSASDDLGYHTKRFAGASEIQSGSKSLMPLQNTNKNTQKRSSAMLSAKEQRLYSANDSGKGRSSGGAVRFITLALLAVVIIAGAMLGAQTLAEADLLPAFDRTSDIVGPTIEKAVIDGEDCHVLIFTGQEDEYIYIPELKRNYKVIQGFAKVTLKDSDWIQENPESGSIEVLLNPVLYTASSKPKQMNPVTYTVEIPPSPLTVISPKDGMDKTYNSMYLVELKVESNSEVYIAGEAVSDLINEDGLITYNVNIEAKGDNSISIRVKTPGCRETNKNVIVNRPFMEIPLEVSPNTPVVHQSKTLMITGKVQPGATLSVKPSPKGSVHIDQAGEFSFEVSLSGYGDNIIELTASMPGKRDSVITHTVNFMPKLDVYSSSAWGLHTQEKYDELMQCYTTSFMGKAFKCTGVIYEMIDANDPMRFYFNVGTSEEIRLIVIEMVSGKTCNEGVKYDIYADVIGGHDGLPLLAGRYRMEKE